MKINNKVIIAIASILIVTILFFSFSYRRVDVIGDPRKLSFYRIFHKDIPEQEKLPEGMKPSPPRTTGILEEGYYLYIKESPQELELNCFEQTNFIVKLGNKGKEVVSDIGFSVEDNANLIFDFPEHAIIPPGSIKDITIFVTADCTQSYMPELNPRITIDSLSFDMSINVRERLE